MKIQTFRLNPIDLERPVDSSLDSRQTLVLLFFSPDAELVLPALQLIRNDFSNSYILGCSSAGEIIGVSLEDRSVAVAVIKFEKTTLHLVKSNINHAGDSNNVGAALGQSLTDSMLRAVLVLSDGLHVNGTELVNGLNQSLPQDVFVTGGLAGDGDRFKNTFVSASAPGEELNLSQKCVAAIGFCGESIHMSFASRGGWSPFGLERNVTRSEDNILYELDGQPALELYKKYLGKLAEGLPATALLFPLCIIKKDDFENSEMIVRTILSIDEEKQSLIFAGDVPQGSVVRLMSGSIDRLVDGAEKAAQSLNNLKESTTLLIAISCVGRRLFLGERTEEELEAVIDSFPAGTRQIGFYSYGELSPNSAGKCSLHNQTMTLTVIQEY